MALNRNALTCWICGRAVQLETTKIDEYGNPVHEQCAVARLTLVTVTGPLPPPLPTAAD